MVVFQKVRRLGSGAFGEAVLYRRDDTGDLVVLKSLSVMEDAGRRVAVDECRILARLEHHNVVRYFDAYEAADEAAIKIEMEYASGGTLKRLIDEAKAPLPEQSVIWFGSQLATALDFLHNSGVMHRDVKCGHLPEARWRC